MELKNSLFGILILSLAATALATDHLSASLYSSVNYGSSPSPASPPPPAPNPSPASPPPLAPKSSPPPSNSPKKPIEKPMHEKPKKSKDGDKKHIPVKMGVEGLIMCKNGTKDIPIKGAMARITCMAINVDGFETAPFSCRSRPTDKNGYFLASFSGEELHDVLKIIECKAFLENSPLKTCKVPTDINNGISGCPLDSFKMLSHNHIKLYSVKTLYYAPTAPAA